MAEDLVFARKASGLVRGLDMWDAFGAGLMTCQPIATLWLMVGIALSLFPTGNLLLSIAIGAVTAGIGAPLVWGILSGSMPRAGGEYVYNSRILHPAIALGAVFANILAIFYWNWFIATWLGVPALQLFAQYMGWWGFADWVASKTGLFVLGLIAVVVGYRLGGLRHEESTRGSRRSAHPRHRRADHPDHRAVPLEQGRLHRQLERDRRPVQVAGLRGVHPGGRAAAHLVGLARHPRRLQRRLRAVRLQLRDRVPQRRGQAPGQEPPGRQHPRRLGADRARRPHRRRPLPHRGVQLHLRARRRRASGPGSRATRPRSLPTT